MKKADLLRCLKEAINGEESATTVYLKHLTALVSRASLPPAELEQVRMATEYLMKSNQRHATILAQVQERVEEDQRDDF